MTSTAQRRSIWNLFRGHGAHWITVMILTALGLCVSRYINENNLWTDARYAITQQMFSRMRRPLYPKRTAVVLIGDDEYWGELAGRSPINREYLSKLVDALEKAGALVVALDFDLRSPQPNRSPGDDPAYQGETQMLANSINTLKGSSKVVLATSIGFASDSDGYVAQPNVYDGLVTKPIEKGYVQLPYDVRRVPLPLDIEDPGGKQDLTVDSFATAIVKSVDAEAYRRTVEGGSDELPFASYIRREEFDKLSTREELKPSAVIRDPATASKYLAGKIVIVSGDWNSRAYGVGPTIDMHPSPVGSMPGSMIHANYIEAMLNERVFHPLPEWIAVGIEILMVLVLAVIAVLNLPVWKQIVTMAGGTFLILLGSFLLQDLGRFFDFFVPFIIVLGHRAVEKVLEWRRDAKQWRRVAGRLHDHAHST